MRKLVVISLICCVSHAVLAQETLQSVTDRGNTTTNSLQIGGHYVNANTTKLFINNVSGKNFALSSGANMITENGFHIYNWTDNPTSPLLSFSNGGNVGIGRTEPKAKLDVNGDILISNALIPMGLMTELQGTATPLLNLSVNFRGPNKDNAYIGGAFRIDTRGQNEGAPLFQWLTRGASTEVEDVAMSLTNGGNLGIGTMTPTERLAVNGKIRAREIKVETANWPDYVFANTYEKMPLSDLEKFIKAYKHLPEMPTATEAERDGIDLGRISKNLVKQQEELVLHLIEKDQEIQKLKTENLEIKAQLYRILKSLKLE